MSSRPTSQPVQPANPFITDWLNNIPSMVANSRSLIGTLKQAASFTGSPGKSRDQELAESATKHREAWNHAKSISVAAKPQKGWELLQLDQSVNLVAFGRHQIDKIQIYGQCLSQDHTMNRNHPLFKLPTSVRMNIYSYCFPPNPRKISLSPNFATKAVFEEGYFDDPFEVMQDVCGALEAFRAIRHELMTYFWTHFYFHATLSPFTGPKFSPLSHIWLMDYVSIVQHLTLEVDFSRFGGGYLAGASQYGYYMGTTNTILCDIFTKMSTRRGTTVMEELDLLCRRYAGVRPPPFSTLSEPTDEVEGKMGRFGRRATSGNTKRIEETKTVELVETIMPDKVPYCPELATLICDSLCEMYDLIQKCRLSGFTQEYSQMLMGALFDMDDIEPNFIRANDLAWPMIPVAESNDEDSTISAANLRTDLSKPANPPTPSPKARDIHGTKPDDARIFPMCSSIFQSTLSLIPSRSPRNLWTSDASSWPVDSTSHSVASPKKRIASGFKSNGAVASAPTSPIALSDSSVAAAHLHRTFSSSGLKYSKTPTTTSPLAQDPKTPVHPSFKSSPLPVTPQTPCFTRSRSSLRSSVKSPTAPTTPNTPHFPRSASAIPYTSASPTLPLFGPYSNTSAVHPSSFSLKLSRSRSFKKDFEDRMLKSKYSSDFERDISRLGEPSLVEQEEEEHSKIGMQVGTIQQEGDTNWEHENIYSDFYDDEGEENYATTPPQLNCPRDFTPPADQVVVETPRTNHVKPPNACDLTTESLAVDRLTPVRQHRHTFTNSPNTMNQLNEQDPAFLRGLNAIRGLEASRTSGCGTEIRPLPLQDPKSEVTQDLGVERGVAGLNNRSHSTRKRYMTFVNKLRGRMEE